MCICACDIDIIMRKDGECIDVSLSVKQRCYCFQFRIPFKGKITAAIQSEFRLIDVAATFYSCLLISFAIFILCSGKCEIVGEHYKRNVLVSILKMGEDRD